MRSGRTGLDTLLQREVDRLDLLMAELHQGLRGPLHYDELEGRADAIAAAIRDAFRKAR